MTDLVAWVIFFPLLVAALAWPAVLIYFAVRWVVGAILDGLDR